MGDLLKARISAREPPSSNEPPYEDAGSRQRDGRTQPALARLGERESRAECQARVRAEVLSRGQGETTAKAENTLRPEVARDSPILMPPSVPKPAAIQPAEQAKSPASSG